MYRSSKVTTVVAIRFPNAVYEQIKASAERNLRGIGREAAALALAGLREQEREKGKQPGSDFPDPGPGRLVESGKRNR